MRCSYAYNQKRSIGKQQAPDAKASWRHSLMKKASSTKIMVPRAQPVKVKHKARHLALIISNGMLKFRTIDPPLTKHSLMSNKFAFQLNVTYWGFKLGW